MRNVLEQIYDNKEISTKLEKAAMLTDSLSNFTPHPGYPFNQAKGCLPDVADSLNLMVDKIQECIDNNQDLRYGEKDYEIVKIEILKNWQEWFIKNQSIYCINDFYSVTKDNRIVGTKFFDTQSLSFL